MGDDHNDENNKSEAQTLEASPPEVLSHPASEDSSEKAASQEEVKTSQPTPTSDEPRGKPWVDFVPIYTHKYPETMDGRLDEQIDTLNQIFRLKEAYKLAAIDQEIHHSYYQMWLNESNELFRTMIRLRLRKANALKGTPQ